MTTTAKAIAGIGGLLATATVPSTYLVISSSSSNSSNSKEATKVDNRKAGTRWLTSSGYAPNKPKFKSQDSLRHGCSENLFSNSKGEFDPTKDTKLYGCAVMSMDLWNTGMRLTGTPSQRNDIDPKWIQFNSEIAVRKGSEGWIINARFDNLSDDSQNSLAYLLTTYKYEGDGWQKNGEPKLWIDPETASGDSNAVGVNSKFMYASSSKLMIKNPKGTWFNDLDWAFGFDDSQEKIKQHVKSENWSGVWTDDSVNGKDSWIFENIELYLSAKKYSQVFCKIGEGDCFQTDSRNTGKRTKNPGNVDTWSNTTNGKYANDKIQDITNVVKEIIGKLQNSRGSWKKLEDICEVDGEPDEKQQELLKMYCTNGKESQ